MQQRQPRVGDIVDDYCPRERRISDHAVVAMVADEVRLVRCTTCDAEHEFKQAKVPPGRKRKAAVTAPPAPPGIAQSPPAPVEGAPVPLPEPEITTTTAPPNADAAPADQEREPEPDGVSAAPSMPEGSVHRRLIRATLPRTDGQAPARPIPEFTMHKAGAPGKSFRGTGGRPPHGQHGGSAHRGASGNSAQGRHAGSGRPQAHGPSGSFAPRGPRGPMGSRPPRGPLGTGDHGRRKKH